MELLDKAGLERASWGAALARLESERGKAR